MWRRWMWRLYVSTQNSGKLIYTFEIDAILKVYKGKLSNICVNNICLQLLITNIELLPRHSFLENDVQFWECFNVKNTPFYSFY